MALHGNLQVNGVTIGLYSIRITDQHHTYGGWFYYEWEYVRADNLAQKYTGVVSHRYVDGVERLLEKVMAAVRRATKLDS